MFGAGLASWRTVLRLVAGGLFFVLVASAHAQANFVFNGGGQTVASSASLGTQRAISGSGVTWSAGTSGYVATARSAANASLVSQGGTAIRLSGSAVTRVAANDLAASAISGIRGGLPGILAAVALTVALDAAHESWDALNKSMVYNPLPTRDPLEMYIWRVAGDARTESSDPDTTCGKYQSLNSFPPGYTEHAILLNNGVPYYCKVFNPANPDNFLGSSLTKVLVTGASELRCPNGVQYDIGTGCRELVSDTKAAGYLGEALSPLGNGGTPGIGHVDNLVPASLGQALTNAGGQVQGAELPSVTLNPASGPTTTTPEPGTNPPTQLQTHTDAIPTCVQNRCAVATQTTKVRLDDHGVPLPNQSPEVSTTQPGQDSGSPDDEASKSCGLTPETACLINEQGTPPATSPLPHADALNAPTTERIGKLPEIISSATRDTALPDGVLEVPAVQGCEPIAFPGGIGDVDPCGPMEQVRIVMDYVWALAGFWIMAGMVKRTIDGG